MSLQTTTGCVCIFRNLYVYKRCVGIPNTIYNILGGYKLIIILVLRTSRLKRTNYTFCQSEKCLECEKHPDVIQIKFNRLTTSYNEPSFETCSAFSGIR